MDAASYLAAIERHRDDGVELVWLRTDIDRDSALTALDRDALEGRIDELVAKLHRERRMPAKALLIDRWSSQGPMELVTPEQAAGVTLEPRPIVPPRTAQRPG